MRVPAALLAVLFALLALASASASTHSASGAHGLVKRACATKTCLSDQYIAQSKAVVDARVAVQQLVASEKKVAAQLKRALKGGKKFARKANAFKKRRAGLVKQLKVAKRTLGAAKNKIAATKAALKKLASGSSSSGGSPSSFTSSKRGLSYNHPKLTTGFTEISSVAWTYNWYQKPLAGVSTAPEFVPMLWGPDHVSTWSQNAKASIKKGSTHLLGMNEPDLASQSNMTVAAAIKLWKKEMVPLASSKFVEGCKNCKISAVAVHWYDRANNVAWFKLYLSKVKALGLPIWITEFAPSGTVAEQQKFFEEVIPWIETRDYIQRYAAFGDYVGTFVEESGALTPLGKTYATA